MPIHDAYARVTPFELLLPTEEFPEERFPLIRAEAEARGGSVDTPDSFLLLGETAMVLREIRGEGEAPERIRQHGALLFQAFHFWEADRPLYLADTRVVRFAVENGPEEGSWSPSLPGRAGYLQLPQHLLWAAAGEGEVPESLDGVFWAAPDGENVTLLVVMGIRKDRPGLAVVPLPTLPLPAAGPWASMRVRSQGEDFSSALPGADLEGLLGIESGAEAVKLVMRLFWYLDVHPGRVVGGSPVSGVWEDGRAGEVAPDPRPSVLPYRRIVTGDGE